jgi:hypothetical protein
MKRSALWLILLAGCTAPEQPPFTVAALDATVVGATPHRRPQPLNCGTPYSFKICPVPLLPVVKVETLPPIAIPVVEIIQLPPPKDQE